MTRSRRAWVRAACLAALALPLFRVSVARAATKGRTVAVWDFDNSSIPDPAAPDWVDSLQRLLPEGLLAGFNRSGTLTAVERVALHEALREQKLGASDLADDRARIRLGRIAGAQHMVFGTYMVIGEQVRVDLRCVDVSTSLIEHTETLEGSRGEVLERMNQAARNIARKVAGEAGGDGGRAVDVQVWSDYDRGLVLMDARRYREAIDVFKKVLARQPDFKPAEKQIGLAAERLSRE